MLFNLRDTQYIPAFPRKELFFLDKGAFYYGKDGTADKDFVELTEKYKGLLQSPLVWDVYEIEKLKRNKEDFRKFAILASRHILMKWYKEKGPLLKNGVQPFIIFVSSNESNPLEEKEYQNYDKAFGEDFLLGKAFIDPSFLIKFYLQALSLGNFLIYLEDYFLSKLEKFLIENKPFLYNDIRVIFIDMQNDMQKEEIEIKKNNR